MLEDFFGLGTIATQEEILEFLKLWGILFAVAFTLRILQRIRNRWRRWRRRRREKREARRR